jgi:hypothetical protein
VVARLAICSWVQPNRASFRKKIFEDAMFADFSQEKICEILAKTFGPERSAGRSWGCRVPVRQGSHLVL